MTTIHPVTTQADLLSALARARGGETILLAPGDYGDLHLAARTRINLTYGSEVTLKSADAFDPAVFTGLDMRGVSNLTLDGVMFDYRSGEGAPLWTRPFQVSESSNIAIRNSVFDGDLARGLGAPSDGHATGVALSIRNSQGITIDNNEAYAFSRGFAFDGADNVAVTGNHLHGLRIDGMTFASVQKVLIAENRIGDFARAPGAEDHCDMIQFWTKGTTRPSVDIVIRNNTLDVGAGDATQSIFMRNDMVDRGLAGPEMFYRNVTITENIIVNGHTHGITVGETAGLVISHNSVLHGGAGHGDGAGAAVNIPRIGISPRSTDVTVVKNATATINGHTGQDGWTVHGNAFVQNQTPLAPGWYGDVFVSSSRAATDGVHDFVALPGGMIDMLGAGAPAMLRPGPDAGPLFHVTGPQFSNHTKTFDAGVMGPQPAGTTYRWDFGDGTTASGPTVAHAFAQGGRYDVTLTLRRADGSLSETTLPMAISGAEILRLKDGGGFAVYSRGEAQLLAPAPGHGAEGLQLGADGDGVSASVARSHVAPLLGATDVTLAMTLTAGRAGAWGEVVRLHQSFIVGLNRNGEVDVVAWSSGGQQVKLASSGVRVDDRQGHDVELRLSGGQLALWVDGDMVAVDAFDGTFADAGRHDLVFGHDWGRGRFHGDLTAFSISLNGDAGLAAPPVPAVPRGLDLVRLDASGGFDVLADGERTLLDPAGPHGADGLQLGAPGVSANVARAHVAPLFGATQATIALSLSADAAGATGEVARLHSAFVITVAKDGNVLVQASSGDGQTVRLASTGIPVNDTSRHDIDLRLAEGRLSLWVDGRMMAEADFGGGFANLGRHDLTFGNTWGKANFNGDLAAFSISLDDAGAGMGPVARALAQPQDAAFPMPAQHDALPATFQPDMTGGWVAAEVADDQWAATHDTFSRLLGIDADPPLM